MNASSIENYKQSLELSKKQRELIVGLLLGDGHLETANGRTYRLKVEHSIKQREYVDWLYQEFKPWVRQKPKAKNHAINDKVLISYWFTTYSSAKLRFYAQQFYVNKKKIMPKLIGKLLSPLALAVWFMDDGSWKSNHHKTYIIHTLGYSKKELAIVRKILEQKYGITIGIHKQYQQWRIYVYSESAPLFRKLIEPYVIPSMKYKLG